MYLMPTDDPPRRSDPNRAARELVEAGVKLRESMGGGRLCGAKTRSGAPCRQRPMMGGLRCKMHGGMAPQVKRKAALRLASLIDPAIGTLAREMVKAEKSADRQRAANSILDRAGVTRGISSELDAARALLVSRLIELQGAPPASAAGVAEPPELVAEVVDDDDA